MRYDYRLMSSARNRIWAKKSNNRSPQKTVGNRYRSRRQIL